jgi:hypothetical protein
VADPRRPSSRVATAGLVLVVAGLAFWALFRYQSGRQHDSFARGGPPATVHLTTGHTYWISIAGGVRRELRLGRDPAALQCTESAAGAAPRVLVIAPQARDTKALNQIGSFTAPVTADVRLQCDGLSAVYVDDSDGAFDHAGLWLLLASVALAVGAPLAVAATVASRASRASGARDPEADGSDPASGGPGGDGPDRAEPAEPAAQP